MKKTLLVVDPGISYRDTREKNITACECDLAVSCPGRMLFRVFASGTTTRKLRQRGGIHIDTPLQALQKLVEQGYRDVTIQSLHIVSSDEYGEVIREVQSPHPRFRRLTLGVPLLSGHGDYARLMQALRQQIPPLAATERVMFMEHGTSHHVSTAYTYLNHIMTVQGFSTRVGAVENYPEAGIVVNGLSRQGATGVHLVPLVLVAGDHAISDMTSDEGDSWKTHFNATDVPTIPWLNGLGGNLVVWATLAAHLQQALNNAMEKAT